MNAKRGRIRFGFDNPNLESLSKTGDTWGVVDYVVYGNATVATIVILPTERIAFHDQNRRLMVGASYCNKTDTFSIVDGVRRACKRALLERNDGYWLSGRDRAYYRAIYAGIRRALP